MQQNEDPHACVSRIDEAVDMLACLEVFRDEAEIIDAIARGLTKDYKLSPVPSSANPVSAALMLSQSLGSDMKN